MKEEVHVGRFDFRFVGLLQVRIAARFYALEFILFGEQAQHVVGAHLIRALGDDDLVVEGYTMILLFKQRRLRAYAYRKLGNLQSVLRSTRACFIRTCFAICRGVRFAVLCVGLRQGFGLFAAFKFTGAFRGFARSLLRRRFAIIGFSVGVVFVPPAFFRL